MRERKVGRSMSVNASGAAARENKKQMGDVVTTWPLPGAKSESQVNFRERKGNTGA